MRDENVGRIFGYHNIEDISTQRGAHGSYLSHEPGRPESILTVVFFFCTQCRMGVKGYRAGMTREVLDMNRNAFYDNNVLVPW